MVRQIGGSNKPFDHTSAVCSVRFSPHYGAVASASTDGTIRIHRINAMMDDLEMYVGVRALVFERWCSSVGVRALVFERWCSSVGVRALVFERWCSSAGVRALVFERWCSSDGVRALVFRAMVF